MYSKEGFVCLNWRYKELQPILQARYIGFPHRLSIATLLICKLSQSAFPLRKKDQSNQTTRVELSRLNKFNGNIYTEILITPNPI